MQCPPFEALIDFADKQLATDAASGVDAHLKSGCTSCQGAVSWYASFAATAAADDSVEPPAWVTRKALALFVQRQKEGVVARAVRLVATLVFDSMSSAPAVGLAGARSAAAGSRQLLFSAPPFDIDLLVATSDAPGSVSVTGQILATDSADLAIVSGLDVEILQDGTAVATAVTSTFGEFAVESLAPGTYDVRVGDASREIVLDAAPIRTV